MPRQASDVTAQINGTFRHRKREYAAAGISEGELFEPSLLDLKPAGAYAACWRGYQAVFAVLGSRLSLRSELERCHRGGRDCGNRSTFNRW